jgi:hypothetical protein
MLSFAQIRSGAFGCTIAKEKEAPAITFSPPKLVETSIPSAGVAAAITLAQAILLQSLHSAFSVFLLHF